MAKSRYDYRVIREVREALKWTIRDVADRCRLIDFDVTDATLANWETGSTTPAADKIDLLAFVFGTEMERFYPRR